MAQSLVIEEDSGTFRGRMHPHNGYYAGDFSATHPVVPERGAGTPRRLHAVVGTPGTTTTPAVPVSWRAAA